MTARRLVLVHGRGPKPAPDALQELWVGALRAGLQRDWPKSVKTFDAVETVLVHHADLWPLDHDAFDAELDLADRRRALDLLVQRKKRTAFRRRYYEELPGKSSMSEFVADVAASALSLLRMGKRAVSRVIPELGSYWGGVDAPLRAVTAALEIALHDDADVMVISHCIGSVLTYDALWQLSHGDAEPGSKVRVWLTLGTPLADDTVRRNLAGAAEKGAKRYPTNLLTWENVAAEDDFTCHDESVANDFSEMLRLPVISRINDHRIYNLTERFGRSNPHSSLGYLVHPKVSDILHDWLHTGST